jgi:hypothetical protein
LTPFAQIPERGHRLLKYLKEDIAHIKSLREKNAVSLNEAKRRKESDAQEARMKARELAEGGAQPGKTSTKSVNSKPKTVDTASTDISDGQQADADEKNDKYILLDEAAHIVSDEALLLKQDSTFADNRAF